MDVAVGSLAGAADGEVVEEAGATAYGAEGALVDAVAVAKLGGGHPCADGEEVDFDLGGEVEHGGLGVRRGRGNGMPQVREMEGTDGTYGTAVFGRGCGRGWRG